MCECDRWMSFFVLVFFHHVSVALSFACLLPYIYALCSLCPTDDAANDASFCV